MKGWLRRWALTVTMWTFCGVGLAGVIASPHVPRFVPVLWIIYTAWWVGIAQLKDHTIRVQDDTIKLLQTQRDLLWQKQRAGLS